MKRAIVLAGGGAKGAYQLGVWRALREHGVTYEIVTGSSIGAVNGAVMVQDRFERMEELWDTITADDIIKNSPKMEKSLAGILRKPDEIAAFVKGYLQNRGMDITPFWELLRRELSEELFFASPIDFGLMTVEFSSLKPVEIIKAQIKPGQLLDWVLASASCFPAFPVCTVDGVDYIDGGYYDNQPIETAIRLGAEEIIAVGLEEKPVHPKYENHIAVTHIRPKNDLGSFLSFEPDRIQKNIAFGYQDAMKCFGSFYGFRYTFTVREKERFEHSAKRFAARLMQIEADKPDPRESVLNKTPKSLWLSEIIYKRATAKTAFEVLLCGVEIFCELLKFPPEIVYSLENMGARLEEALKKQPELGKQIARVKASAQTRAKLLEFSPQVVISAILTEVI